MKNLSVRQFANREGLSLTAVYQRLWAGRIPGAVQREHGRWSIPVQVETSQPSQPLPDWKSRACGPDND